MTPLLARLRERKLVQWGLAYLAGAWLLLQVLDIVGDRFGWPDAWLRSLIVVLAVGFFAVLVVAWYHGERGAQRVSGPELIILALLLFVGGTALALLGGGDAGAEPPERVAATGSDRTANLPIEPASVAVLPFANLSGGSDQEYFSDGLTEELLSALANVPGLRVAARTSSFAFKGREVPVDEIASRLHVAHVVEGSVRRSGDRLRITAQLVNARDGFHVWSETYDRRLDDVFVVQEEIARAITDALQVRLADPAARLVEPVTGDLEAHELYLRAQFQYHKQTRESLERSIALFEAALARDSSLSSAWAGISAAWAWLADDWLPPREAYPKAKAAALRAIALDPTSADAHGALYVALLFGEWDLDGAERALRRQIGLTPTAGFFYDLADFFAVTGQLDSAIVTMGRGQRLDPLAPQVTVRLGDLLAQAGRHEEALTEYRKALELESRFALAHIGMGLALLEQGRADEALEVLRDAPEMGARAQVALARTYAALGRRDEAERIARTLEAESRHRYVRAEGIASIYAALGNRDAAFRLLERAYADRSSGLIWLRTHPRWDPLRADPRFERLVRNVGIQPSVSRRPQSGPRLAPDTSGAHGVRLARRPRGDGRPPEIDHLER